MKTKHLLLTLLALIGSTTLHAYDAEIDGIYYDFLGNEAKVTYEWYDWDEGKPYSDYTGAVVIPSSVTYNGTTYSVTGITYGAFYECSGLTSITIPNSVTIIDDDAFYQCQSLTSVSIPSSVTNIEAYAFSYCTSLASIDIPESVTNIGSSAFAGTLWYDNQPDGLVYAGKVAYEYKGTMPKGTEIIIKEGTVGIAESAFEYCSGLTSITIPNSVTSIGYLAFSYSGLTSVTIPNSVISIDHCVFKNCRSLTSITIGNSVASIGLGVFEYCSSLTSIKVESDNTTYDSRNNCNAIIETATNTLIVGCKNTIIPNSVTRIGNEAFEYCSGLTYINIPNSVTNIGREAFGECNRLTSVAIGSGMKIIGENAFANCSNLTDVYCYAEEVPSTSSYAFEDSNIASATLHVPNASLNAYSTAAPWSGFGNIVAIERTIENLSELSNNRQYLIHTRNESRGTLGVIDNHLASTNPAAYGPWVCRPIVLDRNNPLITNVSQLSSPYTEPTEGSLAAMIDGNTDSFWHSSWSDGDVENGLHYFQVEMLDQADIDIAFKVVRRNTADNHTTEWGIYGTNNANATKAECASLAVIETPYTNQGETRVSDIFKTGGYKYLRFYINNTTTGRGFSHLTEFQLYPATYDEAYGGASPFAIIQKDGGYYLYSVLDKAFITSVNDGDENAHPLCPNDNKMNIDPRDDHFVFSFVGTNLTINVNQKGVVIDDYGKINGKYDDGNLFTIEEVGYFDPTEALAMFDIQTFTVTYNVMFDENVVATATEQVVSGDALPPVPASLYNDFITLTETGTQPTTVTGNVTVTYNATWNGPFKFTKTASDAKWYNMHIRSGYYVGKQDTEPYYPTKDVDEATLKTPAYQWAFGGDPYHVKLYNRSTGLSETLTKDDVNAVMRSGDYTWDLLPNSDGFVLRVTDTEYTCINQVGGTNGPLRFWTDKRSLTDNGSTFRVERVLDYVINDETTSLDIASEESGKIVTFTHDFNGEWEALCLPFAIDYDAIKADFDLAEIDGVVQNDNNNDGIADITVLSIMGFKEQMTDPNTPYLIRAKNAGEQTLQFDDVTVYPTVSSSIDCSSTSVRYEFTGSYNTLNASALAERYVVQGGELVKGASSLAPCRWYMTATARKGSLNLPNRIRIVPVEDVITGSPLLTSPEEEGLIYNLSGQRLSKMQRGINIKNGRKVLIK